MIRPEFKIRKSLPWFRSPMGVDNLVDCVMLRRMGVGVGDDVEDIDDVADVGRVS